MLIAGKTGRLIHLIARHGQMRPIVPALLVGLMGGCVIPLPPRPPPPGIAPETPYEWTELAYQESLHSSLALRPFLQRMPKGADLHNHLSGSIYSEDYINWAIEDGLCVDPGGYNLFECTSDKDLRVEAAVSDRDFHRRLVDALSTRNFRLRERSGHQQFFSTFEVFGPAGANRRGEALAEVLATASFQNLVYLELMISPGMGAAMALAKDMVWQADLQAMDVQLDEAAIAALVDQSHATASAAVRRARELLRCEVERSSPGCEVEVRFLAQVIRTVPAAQVFSQALFGARLAMESEWFVGLNLVAPEDDPIALRDYTKQMQAVGYANTKHSDLNVSLHAGELTLGLVPPRDLRFHIWEAVEIAGADRIGHGVDVTYERDSAELLRTMRDRDILVEINLTSNAVILGVQGWEHPFVEYMKAGVPVALSTDDYGVLRTDLTQEYTRAARTYNLSYADVKRMSYNSVRYSFHPDKAALEAELDRRFEVFEASHVDSVKLRKRPGPFWESTP